MTAIIRRRLNTGWLTVLSFPLTSPWTFLIKQKGHWAANGGAEKTQNPGVTRHHVALIIIITRTPLTGPMTGLLWFAQRTSTSYKGNSGQKSYRHKRIHDRGHSQGRTLYSCSYKWTHLHFNDPSRSCDTDLVEEYVRAHLISHVARRNTLETLHIRIKRYRNTLINTIICVWREIITTLKSFKCHLLLLHPWTLKTSMKIFFISS